MLGIEKSLLPSTIRGANLPNLAKRGAIRKRRQDQRPTGNNAEIARKVRYCFGLDWVEFTATANNLESEAEVPPDSKLKTAGMRVQLPLTPFRFSHVHSGHGSKYYTDMYNVSTTMYGESLPFAVLHVKPRPSFIEKNIVQVKIDNRFCYTPNIGGAINEFCREYGLTFKNFTRLDFFVDVQEVQHYYRNVDQFLHDCATRKLVLKGKGMRPHWTRNVVDGITWGSRSSGVSITMYNKTKEMLKKSWKPWIEQLWKEAHFDMEYDVYRLEFSTKKSRVDIYNAEGETLNLHHDFRMLEKLQPLISHYYHHHFQLAVNKEGERFSRLERYFPLMWNVSGFQASAPCIKPKSNNYTKAFIKRLAVEAMFYQRRGETVQASYTYEHVIDIVDRYSLRKWFDDKLHWVNLVKVRLNNRFSKPPETITQLECFYKPFNPIEFRKIAIE